MYVVHQLLLCAFSGIYVIAGTKGDRLIATKRWVEKAVRACLYRTLVSAPTHLSNQSVGAGVHVQIFARFEESSITRGQLNVCPVAGERPLTGTDGGHFFVSAGVIYVAGRAEALTDGTL